MTAGRVVLYAATTTALTYIAACAAILRLAVVRDHLRQSSRISR